MTDERALAHAVRSRVLEVALQGRPAGRPVGASPPSTPLDAFTRAAEQLHETLRDLRPDEWSAPAHDGHGSVHAVVSHLVGVERLALGWVTAPADAALVETDHYEATAPVLRELAGVEGRVLADLWFEAAGRVVEACTAADPRKPVLVHDLPTDVEGLLVLRAFELWAHLEDVCGAVGRPLPEVEAPRLAMMTSRLMASVPLAVLLRGQRVTGVPPIRFVLTGPAGGTFDVGFLAPDGTPEPSPAGADDVTVVVDAVELCRLAARRRSPSAIGAVVDADAAGHEAVRVVLSTLDAFARD